MKIGEAIEVMRAGGRVCRHGWNGRDMWIALQEPDAHTKMSLPYVYMRKAAPCRGCVRSRTCSPTIGILQDDERAVRARGVTLAKGTTMTRDDLVIPLVAAAMLFAFSGGSIASTSSRQCRSPCVQRSQRRRRRSAGGGGLARTTVYAHRERLTPT